MVQAAKPDRILASNTSVLRPTEIAMHARQPAPRRGNALLKSAISDFRAGGGSRRKHQPGSRRKSDAVIARCGKAHGRRIRGCIRDA